MTIKTFFVRNQRGTKLDHVCYSILKFFSASEVANCFDKPIGVADQDKIPDAQITASSYHSANYQPAYGRLNGNRGDGWCAKSANANNEWLEVDLGKLYTVCAVATQGDRNGNEWVNLFKVSYSVNRESWDVDPMV